MMPPDHSPPDFFLFAMVGFFLGLRHPHVVVTALRMSSRSMGFIDRGHAVPLISSRAPRAAGQLAKERGLPPSWRARAELGIIGLMTKLVLDPSRPCQLSDDLLALWLPRGRGRDALAPGLIATVNVCGNPACGCTDATLQSYVIDDRAERAEYGDEKLRVHWRAAASGPPRQKGEAVLKVDFTTGVVRKRGGGDPPTEVKRFFDEPLPFWVLDALWARWAGHRPPLPVDWKAQALKEWEPGALLPTMLAFPEERPDRYFIEGKEYQADTMFCTSPDCTCTEARLAVLAFNDSRDRLEEIGSARLPPETMVPEDFVGDRRHHDVFTRVYLEWRRRNVPPEARLLELRELTRQRGLELHRLASRRAAPPQRPPSALPSATTARPGRNAPCRCGSGQKYKRCCGK